MFRELTELLRLTCHTESGTNGNYEITCEPHHRLILCTIERLGNERIALTVNCEERSLVST